MKRDDTRQTREAWVLCFILGVVMLNFPFLQIFNKPVDIFGIPLLILYFFIGWPCSIAVIYLFAERATGNDDTTPRDDGR